MAFLSFSSTGLIADTSQLRDPTRPPHKKQANPSNHQTNIKLYWHLSSTLIAHGRRHAVINGKLVSPGQTIQQAKLISIEPNKVWLLHNKKRFSIKLLAKEIKDFSKSAAK